MIVKSTIKRPHINPDGRSFNLTRIWQTDNEIFCQLCKRKIKINDRFRFCTVKNITFCENKKCIKRHARLRRISRSGCVDNVFYLEDLEHD
jgi:hypothetical protein